MEKSFNETPEKSKQVKLNSKIKTQKFGLAYYDMRDCTGRRKIISHICYFQSNCNLACTYNTIRWHLPGKSVYCVEIHDVSCIQC